MELREFIAESLKQLIDGVKEAGDYALDREANVVPSRYAPGSGRKNALDIRQREVQDIEFDIAVTATAGSETKGGIGVVAGIVGVGARGQTTSAEQTVSRIRFTIPVVFPSSERIKRKAPRTA